MKIAISTESAADLNKEIYDEFSIHVVPFTVTLGEKTFLDGELTNEEMFAIAEKNKVLPKTSAVNVEQFKEHFAKLREKFDAVIHVSMSSLMSSAYNNAVSASKEFENVFVVDSFITSSGVGLLAIYASQLVREGLPVNAVIDKLNARKSSIVGNFEIKSLQYLYKGGRCSALKYFGANLLKIRPQIIMKNGIMSAGKKFRGSMEHVIECNINDTFETYDTPDLSLAIIAYSTATEEMLNVARNNLKNRGFKRILTLTAGATTSSHGGDNSVGIFFFNDSEI